jgi:hypothetical protein
VIALERSDAEAAPAPAPTEEQQRDPTTCIEGPLLSGLVPPNSTLLPGTVTEFPQDFNEEGAESDRSDESLGTDAGVDPAQLTAALDLMETMRSITMGTSSDEQRLSPEIQPVPFEDNQSPCARPTAPEQIMHKRQL